MSRVRVMYVLKRYPQLSQTFVVRELRELEQLGVEIGVEALAGAAGDVEHAEVREVRADVRWHGRGLTLRSRGVLAAHSRTAARRPLVWSRLARAARREESFARLHHAVLVADRARRDRVDHLHAHFVGVAAEVARDAARLAGCSWSVTAHARDIFHDAHASHLAARTAGVGAIVTVSAFNAAHLRNELPCREIVHVPNGIPVEQPVRRDAFGPLLCVARLVEKKGIDTLLHAFAESSLTAPWLRLEIVGDGELAESLHALAARLGIAGRVEFLGACDSSEVDAAYRRAAMVVLACRVSADGDRDGMPTVLLEAMARALPVVSTDVIGIPELVHDGETGLLVGADDPAALATAISKLWADPALADELGGAGRRHVTRHADPARSAHLLLDVFHRCSSGKVLR